MLMEDKQKKVSRLTKRGDFQEIFKQGKSVATKGLVLYILPNELGFNRSGFIASKKVGNAVIRNRIKRLLKEAYRSLSGEIISGFDLVFIARLPSAKYEYFQAAAETERVIRRSGLLRVKKSTGETK